MAGLLLIKINHNKTTLTLPKRSTMHVEASMKQEQQGCPQWDAEVDNDKYSGPIVPTAAVCTHNTGKSKARIWNGCHYWRNPGNWQAQNPTQIPDHQLLITLNG